MIFASFQCTASERLSDQVVQIERIGLIAGLHVDMMGCNPQAIAALRRCTGLPLEVHLIGPRATAFMKSFADAGATRLIVQAETCRHLHTDILWARALGVDIGVALDAATPLFAIDHVLEDIDQVLLDGADPEKISSCRRMIDFARSRAILTIESGVKIENAARLILAGAHALVIGSSAFAAGELAA